MFLTERYVCFSCDIPLLDIKLKVAYVDIIGVDPSSPNAALIRQCDGQEFIFSFLKRGDVVGRITEYWYNAIFCFEFEEQKNQLHVPEESLEDMAERNKLLQEWVTVPEVEQQDKEAEGEKLDDWLELRVKRVGEDLQSSAISYDSDEFEEKEDTEEDMQREQAASTAAKTAAASSKEEAPGSSSSGEKKEVEVAQVSDKSGTPFSFGKSEQKAGPIIPSFDVNGFDTIFKTTYPITLQRFAEACVDDGGIFGFKAYLASQADSVSAIDCEKWFEKPATSEAVRMVRFKMAVHGVPFVSELRVKKLQTLRRISDKHLEIYSINRTEGARGADCYELEDCWQVTQEEQQQGPPQVTLRISTRIRFLKPTLLKGMIKSMVKSTLPAQMQDWDKRFRAVGLF
jgi:hypothetical protein